jgi:small subunit ribosomal protein S1
MSEQPNAEPTPTPLPGAASAAPAAPKPAGREAGQRKQRDFNRKPAFKAGPVPAITDEQAFGVPPRLGDLDAEIAGELEEAMGGLSDKDLYGEEQRRAKAAAPGQQARKKGKVLRIHGPDVFIDVPGGRSQGVLPMLQFPDGPPAIGAEVEVSIEGYDHANGLLLLSRKGAAVEADWSSIAEGMTVEARVTASNKGGLEVDINGIRGFLPISQIELFRVENIDAYINQRLLCLVTEVVPSERNLVVSRRALLEKEREEARDKLWTELAEGQVRQGIVRSVRDFGAFVDLGGADGLLHVSEMSWNRVQDPTTILQPGQSVKVAVLKVDREKRKISLGLKQLQPSPWDDIEQRFVHSQVFNGKVTRLMDFGAFVELEPGIEGLIHISELAPQRVFRVSDIVQAGQEVKVMVLKVDKEQRRISLSLKAALPEDKKVEEVEEEEEQVEVKPPRPRTTPLRGGLGE